MTPSSITTQEMLRVWDCEPRIMDEEQVHLIDLYISIRYTYYCDIYIYIYLSDILVIDVEYIYITIYIYHNMTLAI